MASAKLKKIIALWLGLMLLAAPLHGAFAGVQQMLHPAVAQDVAHAQGHADHACCQDQAPDDAVQPCSGHTDDGGCSVGGHCCHAFAVSYDLAVVPVVQDHYFPVVVSSLYIFAAPLAKPPRSLSL